MRADIEEDPEWGVPALFSVVKRSARWKAPVGKKRSLITVAQNESVANYSAMNWAESTKWVNAHKGERWHQKSVDQKPPLK